MSWLPKTDELNMSNFINPPNLDSFLLTLLNVREPEAEANCVSWLKSSLGQDLTYASNFFFFFFFFIITIINLARIRMKNDLLELYLILLLILNCGGDCVDFFIFNVYIESGSNKLFKTSLQIASAKFQSSRRASHQPAF